MLLKSFLRRFVRRGTLTVADHRGRRRVFGDGGEPRAAIRLHGRWAGLRLMLNPTLYAGEAYMDGRITLESGTDLGAFIELGTINLAQSRGNGVTRSLRWLAGLGRRLTQFNPVRRARRNAAHHYDLSDALYEQFLDSDRQYSCAYFKSPTDDLETAQAHKKAHIASKLLIEPGQRILDIGCGWGGLARYLHQVSGARVLGITLSEEQLKFAQAKVADQSYRGRVEFRLEDYRQVEGPFDRIVSVGMFEHVGVPHYPEFFRRIGGLLNDRGAALIHTIGRIDSPSVTDPWTRKYIFPGGYCPALSELVPVIERAGLVITDVEILRLHYAETLRAWRERFARNRNKVRAIYDERFCRMWEFYLAGSEAAFRHGGLVVFQIQLAKSIAAVPITRDYITEAERALEPLPSTAA